MILVYLALAYLARCCYERGKLLEKEPWRW